MRAHGPTAPAWLALLALAVSCAPSAGQVRRARTAGYQAPFAVVWNAVASEVRAQFPRIVVDDAAKGRLVTDWRLVERSQLEVEGGDEKTGPTAVRGGTFFRMTIDVAGGPPWRVAVDGEAAEYRPGMAMLIPFAHGAADEPPWVAGRIDRMYVRIHERLARHAVTAPASAQPASLPAADAGSRAP